MPEFNRIPMDATCFLCDRAWGSHSGDKCPSGGGTWSNSKYKTNRLRAQAFSSEELLRMFQVAYPGAEELPAKIKLFTEQLQREAGLS